MNQAHVRQDSVQSAAEHVSVRQPVPRSVVGSATARHRRAIAAALVDVCRTRTPSVSDDPAVVEGFVRAAQLHRIAPLAHVLLRGTNPTIAAALQRERDVAVAVHLRAAITLDVLRRVLDDIPWAAFKGPVLSELAHPEPGLRTYHDVDVLVSPHSLREVTQRLQDAGWVICDHRDHYHGRDTPGEMHWCTPSGLVVDLHWSMINVPATRRRHNVPTDDLLARRRRANLGLSHVSVLDEVDAFVHVCMHAGLSGAHRLLWLLDADQLAHQTTDWDRVVARARAWQVEAPVAVVLARAQRFLGSPVPTDVTSRLGVTSLSRWVARGTDRLWPVPAVVQEQSMTKLVARGVRRGGLRSITEVIRRLAIGTWQRRRTYTQPDPAENWVPADHVALTSYLAAVEREASEMTVR